MYPNNPTTQEVLYLMMYQFIQHPDSGPINPPLCEAHKESFITDDIKKILRFKDLNGCEVHMKPLITDDILETLQFKALNGVEFTRRWPSLRLEGLWILDCFEIQGHIKRGN